MYPVMLDISGCRCLVVGGGGVALRKVQGLVDDDAAVVVVARAAVAPLEAMAAAGLIELVLRDFDDADTAGCALVFAATDDPEVNRRVAAAGRTAGALVNVADDAADSSFHLPARIRRGSLQLAVGSRGEAPFAIRRLRQVLERLLGEEWAEWIDAAGRFRQRVLGSGLTRSEREARYDLFFTSTVDSSRLGARVPTEDEERAWLGGEDVDHQVPIGAEAELSAEITGRVSLVGSGPGCPGLLTVRGRERLAEADAVVYDRLAAAALPTDLPASTGLHPVGKVAGNHPVPQEEINALLIRLAREGKRVVRLKGGDPYVFGRGGEEAQELAAAGVPFEVVPGVTSGVAALAWAGIPVTHRRESVRLELLTAHEAIKSDGPQVHWETLAADPHATLVGYMGVTALPSVVEQLLAAGMAATTPAAVVQRGTTSAQRSVVSTLSELPAAVAAAGLGPPALFVIGPTVRHADRLDWYGRLPLARRRILVAGGRDLTVRRLEEAGADVVAVPLPVTPAARIVMSILPLTDCLVSSPAEVEWLDDERDSAPWAADATLWAVGAETAERAEDRGWSRIRKLGPDPDPDALIRRMASRA